MKTKLFLVLSIVFLLIYSCEKEDQNNPEPIDLEEFKSELLNSEVEFSLDLFLKIQSESPDSNLCLSPYSAYVCLAMAANGAQGLNLLEFLNVLGLSKNNLEALNQVVVDLRDSLLNADPMIKFTSVNSLWYNNNWQVYADYQRNLREYYDAKVSALDFGNPTSVDTINEWVSYHTNDKINDLVNYISPSDVCFLINAVYFNGQWTQVFDRDNTRIKFFYLPNGDYSECNMMNVYGVFNVIYDDKIIAAELPYGNKSFAMYVFMSRQRTQPLADFYEENLLNHWPVVREKFLPDTTIIKLPQFSFENDYVLNDHLINMGLTEAFESSADFSKMGPGNLWISKVRQKTFIDVNEDGTEAAAATAISVTGSPSIPYTFNRPFIYVIADRATGTIIFIGQVTDPKID